MNFYENIKAQLDFMKRLSRKNEKIIEGLPEGVLEKHKQKGKDYYYLKQEKEKISLLDKPEMLRDAIMRSELTEQNIILHDNIETVSKLSKLYTPVLESNRELWDKIADRQNSFRPEDLKHQYKGKEYRSKSEIAIIMMLESFGIETKYEARMKVNGYIFYPDATFLRPRDNKLTFWEHLGLINDQKYLQKAYNKILNYQMAGITLWDNLIITFDKDDGGIDVDYIRRIIECFVL